VGGGIINASRTGYIPRGMHAARAKLAMQSIEFSSLLSRRCERVFSGRAKPVHIQMTSKQSGRSGHVATDIANSRESNKDTSSSAPRRASTAFKASDLQPRRRHRRPAAGW